MNPEQERLRRRRTCGHCWYGRERAGDTLTCHLEPPVLTGAGADASWERPIVAADDTCRWWRDQPDLS